MEGNGVLMKRCLFLALLLVSTACWSDDHRPHTELRPFETDGCTMAPDGTINRPRLWRDCCVAHDLAYWGGGSKDERNATDAKLQACIKKKAGPGYAFIFRAGVFIGSLSPIRLESKRWGNAWYERAGYRTLSNEELQRLIDQLNTIEVPSEIREAYRAELEARLTNGN